MEEEAEALGVVAPVLEPLLVKGSHGTVPFVIGGVAVWGVGDAVWASGVAVSGFGEAVCGVGDAVWGAGDAVCGFGLAVCGAGAATWLVPFSLKATVLISTEQNNRLVFAFINFSSTKLISGILSWIVLDLKTNL